MSELFSKTFNGNVVVMEADKQPLNIMLRIKLNQFKVSILN